jgi:hypothetical protein
MPHRIMYVCEICEDNFPEGCGRYDRHDLRILPSGKWVCDACFDDMSARDFGEPDEEGEYPDKPSWLELPTPPEYVPATTV